MTRLTWRRLPTQYSQRLTWRRLTIQYSQSLTWRRFPIQYSQHLKCGQEACTRHDVLLK